MIRSPEHHTFTPITNTYSLTAVTNFTPPGHDTFYRVVTTPDILFHRRRIRYQRAGGPDLRHQF